MERCQELGNRAGLTFRQRPVDLVGRLAVIAAGVCLDDARINCKALAFDEACIHACSNHCLENMAQDVAVAEAAMAIDRERRVIGNPIVEIEPAEPSVGEMSSTSSQSRRSKRMP